MEQFRIIKQVPRIVYGLNSFKDHSRIIDGYRNNGYAVFLVDEAHNLTGLKKLIEIKDGDLLIDVETKYEPKTDQVDSIRDRILEIKAGKIPAVVVGIGGGSSMDVAKAVSVMLTNEGGSTKYQGWDLVKNPAVPKIAIPTLSGTGAESSRTAVLTAKDKKYGINSDQSMFDLIILDPVLIKDVPNEQRFHTGMDCYIHCVESLNGSFINSFGRIYASNALSFCQKYFLKKGGTDEELMLASYLGGASVANSEVGVCHALSYGLSLILNYRHGIANCIAFNQLDEFYGEYVAEFRNMTKINNIILPAGVCRGITDEMLEKMVQMTLKMERPLTSALGENWRNILTPAKIKELYLKM